MGDIALHNTDIGTFKQCRQLWDFTSPLRFNLEPQRPQEPFEFGTLWHSILEAYYSGVKPEPIHKLIDAYIEDWAEKLGESPMPEDEETLEGYQSLGHGMFDNYRVWAPSVDDFDIILLERAFEVPVTDDLPPYGFKPDGVVRTGDGLLWILEDKSAAKLPGQDTDYLLTDDQCGRYLWGLHRAIELSYVPELEPGTEIEGIIYNIARKVAPSPLKINKDGSPSIDKKQITTFDIAREQIVGHFGKDIPSKHRAYLDLLRVEGYSKYFFRQKVRRSQREIANIGVSFILEGRDMVNDPSIYRTPSSFNCNRCAFLGPCLAKWEGTDYKAVLAGNYQERVS